jgi:uncharacterized protein
MKKKSCRRRTKIVRRSKKHLRRIVKRKSLSKGRRRQTQSGGEKEGCTADKNAQFHLGAMYQHGDDGVEKNLSEALKWFTRANENGNQQAISRMAEVYYSAAQYTKAYDIFIKLATQQNDTGARAMYTIGSMFYYGRGRDIDYEKAADWYAQAARQGHTMAQYNMGVMYQHGEGVEKDDAKAAEWYNMAVERGYNPDAMVNLGLMYQNGEGVEKDDAKAKSLYESAGTPSAQYCLAYMYEKGKGVLQDSDKAIDLYRHAARSGYEDANNALQRLGARK